MPLKVDIEMSYNTYHKAQSLCNTLGIHNFNQLWDQLIEELEWNTYHAVPVRAALLQRLVGSAAAGPNPTGQTSKEK